MTVSFGQPLPANTTAFEVRQAVQELLAYAWHHRRDRMETFAARNLSAPPGGTPFRFAMADAQNAEGEFRHGVA